MKNLLGKFHISYLVVVWSAGVIICMALGYGFGMFKIEYYERIIGTEIVLRGRVVEDPEMDDAEMVLRLGDIEIGNYVVGGMVYAKLVSLERIERSDIVVLRGRISEGFGVFAGAMWRPDLEEVLRPDPPDAAIAVRNWFGGLIRRYIPEPQVNLAQGYLLGQRRSLSESFSKLLNEVGLMHIVVASGYNLSILVGVARRIFGRVSRFAALFFALLMVAGFAGVAGLSASMVRASWVVLLGILAWYTGRKFHPVKLLLLVAAITLLISPMYIMDLGWLLSFASFAGVMVVGPILLAYFYGESKPNFAAAVLVETMAAQMCCLPIILFFSGSFSLVSVLANVLILPTIPVAMLLTFATGCFAFLPPIAAATGWLANLLLSCHIAVVEFFGNMQWAMIKVPIGNAVVFFGYLAIFFVVVYMKKRTKFRLINVDMLELH